ncbi:hypothetical protein E2562_000770 [Oryza meyeriana var. granulata]|uniref:Uncharacterized protein n=1 Tax=Oryza meyeriana var. granulata TaxID=110450 RepID=A0A6G1DUN8_9ORYZ|nr:hypothetical protein E2562_000770 [Oryza meyeriana var. granulata]
MKATISDLEAEANFFESTATEASEGSEASSSAPGLSDKDKEHARIMARLDEVEMEEKDAGSTSKEDDEDDEEDTGPNNKLWNSASNQKRFLQITLHLMIGR